MYGLRMAPQSLQDEIYPMHKVQEIDEVIDALYSVDIADVSFQLGALTFKPMAIAMDKGPKMNTSKL